MHLHTPFCLLRRCPIPNTITYSRPLSQINREARRGFTLVELIVVITILAILGTIAFISLNNFSASARDAKRLSDVRSLYTKLTLENVKGTKYEDLVNVGSTSSMLINGETRVVAQGVVNFGAIKENRDNFLDPSTNTDYPVAFHEAGLVASLSTETRDPSILEIATINEEKNLAVVVGNYFPLIEGDTAGLILSGGNNPKIITNDSGNLPYDIGNGNGENTDESAIEIYGDEGETEIRACEKWITDNIPADKGEWIWVPAREEYFINDLGERELGEGEEGYKGMDDDYYKRNVTYNDVKYICKGFAVARYEMSYNEVVAPNSSNGDWNTVAYTTPTANSGIVSIADRYPIADINQQDAIDSCKSIGANFHLITNNEWMTIARNIEQQTDNWKEDNSGNKYLSNGLTNDGVHGCGAGNSKSIYTLLDRAWASKTGKSDLSDPTACNTKRQLVLSNNSIIWDLSGNILEHVNKANTIDGANYVLGLTKSEDETSTNWTGNFQWHATGWSSNTLNNDREKYGPLSSTLNHTTNGVGNIHGTYRLTTATPNIFLRGAGASYDAYAGVFTLRLGDVAGREGGDVGFRCAL